MHIYRHWKRITEHDTLQGRPIRLTAWGGSLTSSDEAQERALARLKIIREKINQPKEPWEYGYSETDIREPIHEELLDDQGQQIWVITRNRYGALVLNAKNILFIDVDHIPAGCLALFSKNKKQKTLEKVQAACEASGLDLTLYETAAGFRILVTDKFYDPRGDEAAQLLASFKSDELYARLCRRQNCFRARLTPKYFRLDLPCPKIFVDTVASDDNKKWIELYTEVSRSFAVCRQIDTYGTAPTNPAIIALQQLHDKYCLGRGLPLA